jgi:RNA polymerase sigma factor (sigma-70 family)
MPDRIDPAEIPALYAAAKLGDMTAAGRLVTSQEGWCVKQAALYAAKYPAADRDELIQVGRIAVFTSIAYFDPTTGDRWENYAQACAVKNIARAVRKAVQHRQRFPLPDSAEVGDRLASPDGSIMESVPGPAAAFRWLAADLVRAALARLTEQQREMVSRVYGIERPAEPPRAVAKSLGLDAAAFELRLATAMLTLSLTPGLEALLDPDYTPEASP